jgi:ribosomal protein S18 acetylase RimI-like enzyme
MAARPRSTAEIQVRPVREDEWQDYRDLRLKALKTDPLAFGSTLQREQAFSPGVWKERVTRGHSTLASVTWVAVSSTERFVGMIVAADLEGTIHLFAMWVDPEFRGVGIGRQLLDTALTWIQRSHPGRAVVLEVNPRQVTAVHLYQSRGFRFTGNSSPLGHTPDERVVEMTLTPIDVKTNTPGTESAHRVNSDA